MKKLNLVVEDAPVKELKNKEAYLEIAKAFEELTIGKAVRVENSELSSLSIIANIKDYITLKEGEDIRISRLYGDDKKLSGVRLIKQTYKPRKQKQAGTEVKLSGTTTSSTELKG